MEFDFNEVVSKVRNGISGNSTILVGEAVALAHADLHAIKVSFAIMPAGVGINIEVNRGAMEAIHKVLPDGEYDRWCAETITQIGASPWFKERCEKLTAIMCKADMEFERREDLHGTV